MTRVSVRRLEGRKLLCTAGRHSFFTDRKVEDGGADSGCTSGELLLLAIGSCATGSLRTFLHGRGLGSDGLAVEVSLQPSPTGRDRDMILIEVALPGTRSCDRAALEAAAISGGVVSRVALGSEIAVRVLPESDEKDERMEGEDMAETGAQDVSSLVSPAWLEAHRGDPDLRLIEIAGLRQDDMQAYKAGHVPGAICWRWKEMLWDSRMRDFPTPEEFARRMGEAGIGNDSTVVVYGEDVQFGIYAWWVLRYCGHRNVKVLDGARYRWAAEGRPLETAFPPPPAPVAYRPVERVPGMRILRDEVLAALAEGTSTIVDARSPEEYRGERVGGPGGPDTGAVRPGRIPGARHVFYQSLLDGNKAFRPASELRDLLAGEGVSPDRPVIAYCRMSHRATVAYFALTQLLGFEDVRVYDGSWTEWGNLVGVPIER